MYRQVWGREGGALVEEPSPSPLGASIIPSQSHPPALHLFRVRVSAVPRVPESGMIEANVIFNEKNTDCGKRGPSFPTIDSSASQLSPSPPNLLHRRAIHHPWPRIPSVCACVAKGCCCARIHDNGHICIGHRALDGTAWGGGGLGHPKSAYCACWLHRRRFAYPSPTGMASSWSLGSTLFLVRTLNSRFPSWSHLRWSQSNPP